MTLERFAKKKEDKDINKKDKLISIPEESVKSVKESAEELVHFAKRLGLEVSGNLDATLENVESQLQDGNL